MKIKVDDFVLTEWKKLRFHKDIKNIVEAVKKQKKEFTRADVSIAINYGYGEPELIKIISEYYDNKKDY